uniref:Pumilio homolog 3 n=1 Tax=Cacopsylla melanoneura TaxID=428564 RepID=A0A8D8RHL6_9HEMI
MTMKRKSEESKENSTLKKIKTENVPGGIQKTTFKGTNKPLKGGPQKSPINAQKGGPQKSFTKPVKGGLPQKPGLKGGKERNNQTKGDIDITQSLTDTGASKSKKFRFEKSGGKKAGKFKKAEAPDKKPDWNEFKKKKKEVQKKRKMGNSQYDVVVESKKIWEQVRRADCPDEKKQKLLTKLHGLLKGKMDKIVFSHDMSRIIQWLLKLSSPQMRKEIVSELLPHTIAMIQSKYSNALVKHMLKNGDEATKNEVIKVLQTKVVTLLSHTTASPILMYAHDQVASPGQKLAMRQELYGGLYQSTGDAKISCLGDIFEKSPEMKSAILSVTKKTIIKCLQKEHITSSSLLHAVLQDFISHSGDSPDLTEVLEMLAPLPILQFVHSKPGSSVAMHIIWNATNKLKKNIVKELKGHIREVATSEFGHLALVTLLDNVDDTLLLKKALLPELLEVAEELAANEYGRKVLAHVNSWCDPGFYHPSFIVQVKAGDDFSTSKKDRDVRNKEIHEFVSDPLLASIASNPDFWLKTSSVAMVTAVILNNAVGPNLKEAFDSVATVLVDLDRKVKQEIRTPATNGAPAGSGEGIAKKKKKNNKKKAVKGEGEGEAEEEEVVFIEHAGFHMVLKKLIQHDKKNVEKNLPTLSESVVAKLSDSVLDTWTQCNRACFILVSILECGPETCVSELKSKLSSYKTNLSSQSFFGAKILLGKLE